MFTQHTVLKNWFHFPSNLCLLSKCFLTHNMYGFGYSPSVIAYLVVTLKLQDLLN
jgi:hypothetical protein